MEENTQANIFEALAKKVNTCDDPTELMLVMMEYDLYYVSFDKLEQICNSQSVIDTVWLFVKTDSTKVLSITNTITVYKPNSAMTRALIEVKPDKIKELLSSWFMHQSLIQKYYKEIPQ